MAPIFLLNRQTIKSVNLPDEITLNGAADRLPLRFLSLTALRDAGIRNPAGLEDRFTGQRNRLRRFPTGEAGETVGGRAWHPDRVTPNHFAQAILCTPKAHHLFQASIPCPRILRCSRLAMV